MNLPPPTLWRGRAFLGPVSRVTKKKKKLEILIIYRLGFTPNYYKFALILLIKIVLYRKLR